MKNKLMLSIAMTSLIGLNIGQVQAEVTQAQTQAQTAPAKADGGNGGKCASGKCGTEKRFEKKELINDPQGQLVRARDGKCGLSGQGITSDKTPTQYAQPGKCAGGLCGQ
ncbi:hypothetical protein [Moritella sp. 28]|uniref:hypothetical protein n=1 Tax=Moritella sp. 28 TaxID=2746232 RepID=UPI001BA72371|nr:hypothetical protein [Moritella sp. 28]QUM85529.1 hypothetical protein HWV02_13940 [Moritella sp. 28]